MLVLTMTPDSGERLILSKGEVHVEIELLRRKSGGGRRVRVAIKAPRAVVIRRVKSEQETTCDTPPENIGKPIEQPLTSLSDSR